MCTRLPRSGMCCEADCDRFSELPAAYSNMGASITYAELDEASRDFAAYLQNSVGLHKGDRVALMMPNLLQYPVALFGVLRTGLVVVNVNPQYTVPELEHQLKDSGAVAIVVLENFAHAAGSAGEEPTMNLTVITTEVGDMFPVVKELVTNVVVKYVKKMVPGWKIPDPQPDSTRPAGGRGQTLHHIAAGSERPGIFAIPPAGPPVWPRAPWLTHGSMVANVQQLGAWIAPNLLDGETLICPLPLYHVFALTCSLVFMKIGSHTILITNREHTPLFMTSRSILSQPSLASTPCTGPCLTTRISRRWTPAI